MISEPCLKVRPQTLYAYVSRGRVSVRPDPADPRRVILRQLREEEIARMLSGAEITDEARAQAERLLEAA